MGLEARFHVAPPSRRQILLAPRPHPGHEVSGIRLGDRYIYSVLDDVK